MPGKKQNKPKTRASKEETGNSLMETLRGLEMALFDPKSIYSGLRKLMETEF